MIKSIRKQENLQKLILIFFYISITIVIFSITEDFGIHIEEKFHRLNGLYWLNYVSGIFDLENLRYKTELKIIEINDYTLSPIEYYNKYGVIFDLPIAFVEIVFEIDQIKNLYEIKHFFSFLIFLISSYFFFLILKKRFKNFFICLIGTTLFLTTPRIFGDSFLYKDVLFLSFFNIALYFFLKTIDATNYKNLILLSLFTALAFCLRVFAIFIPVTFLFIVIVKVLQDKKIKYYLINFFIFIIFFIFFIYCFSPYLWSNPFNNFLDIFSSLRKDLISSKIKILFDGDYVFNRYVPEYYLIKWIFITTPIIILFFFSFGYVSYLARLIKRFINIKEQNIHSDLWRGKNEQKDFIVFFLLTSIFFSLLIFNSPFYNGWRLVYFFNIFIIYIFIYQINNILIFIKQKILKRIIYITLIFSVAYNLTIIYIYHPFQSYYFNELSPNNMYEKYEIDYYGLAGKKFFLFLHNSDKSDLINVAVASHTPLHRSLEGLDNKVRKRFNVVGQEYKYADYIFKNNISEVNSRINMKYNIPINFDKFEEFKINKILIYEVFKRQNLK